MEEAGFRARFDDWDFFDRFGRAREAAVDFRKLEAFLTVANTGKFITAAEKLFISQSSLSKQMAQLEQDLDVKLFKKTRNGVELTQAGHDFYAYARHAVPEYQYEVKRLKTYRENTAFPLVVGALPLTEEYGFADSFSSYWVRNTSAEMQFVERNQEDLLDKLKRHKIDIALARTDYLDDAWFDSIPVVSDELTLVCPVTSPLSQRDSVSIDMLRNETFILLLDQSYVTRMFIDACSDAGFRPNAPLQHSRHRMIIKAIQRRMGISVLSRRLVSLQQPSDIACIPFEEPLVSTIGFIWPHGKPCSAVAQEFMDFVCRDFNRKLRRESP